MATNKQPQQLEKAALRILLPDADEVLTIEHIKQFASESSILVVGALRELVCAAEKQIEARAATLGEEREGNKVIDEICNQFRWSFRTSISELRSVALHVVKERSRLLEEKLRAEVGGRKDLAQITREAREVAALIENRSQGWPVGCIGI